MINIVGGDVWLYLVAAISAVSGVILIIGLAVWVYMVPPWKRILPLKREVKRG